MSLANVLGSFFQFEINSKLKPDSFVYIVGSSSSNVRGRELKSIIERHAFAHGKADLLKSEKSTLFFSGQNGPVWVLQAKELKKSLSHNGQLDESVYAWFRDQAGALPPQIKSNQCGSIELSVSGASDVIVRAVIVGLELASYNYLSLLKGTQASRPRILVKLAATGKKLLESALVEARAVQLARHLVNLPPNLANPETIEQMVKKEMGFPKSVAVEVWDNKKLLAEGMNLIAATGAGSDTPPRMVRIKYRAKGKSKKPIAFVGKGITFDTGGLDLKPSSAMRLMKKDMGGAAAVLGLAYWAVHSRYGRDCDFYLALAENSVGAKSMRPGDIYTSRAGYMVEIDNTDAEGRLVLADVMDVAVTQKGKDEPEILIDIATLTGAIKVALGVDVAGLFCNNDALAQQIQNAGTATGDLNWRMPLIQKYFSSLSSPFADFKNSGESFGGAITAALFLEKFAGNKKWAHLDVYSWNDKVNGALNSTGGSGQPVQSMIEWLKKQV